MKKSKLLSLLLIVCVCISSMFMFGFTPAENVNARSTGQTVTQESHLGMGINVLTAENLIDYKTGYSILDYDALYSMTTGEIAGTISNSDSFSTTSARALLSRFNTNLGVDVAYSTLLCVLEAQLDSSMTVSFEEYSYKYYYIFSHYIQKYVLYIQDYLAKSTYQNAYSTLYLNDLACLSAGDLSYVEFFNRYGTHLVGSAIYGGRLDAYYTLVSNKEVFNENTKTAIDTSISAYNISATNLSTIVANLQLEIGSSIEITTQDIIEGFSVDSMGGTVIVGNSLANFDNSYIQWCNSFNDNPSTPEIDEGRVASSLIDYVNGGLVPLWDILPTEYESLSNDMRAAFIELCETASGDFIDKFKTGNYVDYNGGTGTALDPYVITNADQLKNIEKNMSSHFVLANDITMPTTQWKAIGGHYKNNYFTGVLDGNDYTIDGLKRTSNISESNNKFYFGLFGAIGEDGVVKDLNFTNVNIYIEGPSGNSNSRVFIGTVAGYCAGRLENITVDSDRICFNLCTPGISFVGGLVGTAYEAVIKDCTNIARAIKSARYSGVAGGIAGASCRSVFENCTVDANIIAFRTPLGGYATAGGICGETLVEGGEWSSEFINCVAVYDNVSTGYFGNISGGTPRKNEITNNGYTLYV